MAAGEEVEPGRPDLAEPGVVVGQGPHVDGEGSITSADHRPGVEDLRPAPRAAVGERLQRPRRWRGRRVGRQRLGAAAGHQHLDHPGRCGARDAEHCGSVASQQARPGIADELDSHRVGGQSHDQLGGRRAHLQGAGEDRDLRMRRIELAAGHFEDGGCSDVVGEDHLVAVAEESLVTHPGARQGSVAAAVPSADAEIVKARVVRVGPAGPVAVGDVDLTEDPRVDLVAAVEIDAVPVDEALAGPGGRHSERVVVVDDPGVPPRHAAGPRVEPDGDPLVGEVGAVAADFVGRHQGRSVIHHDPGLDRRRRRAPAGPLGEPVQVLPIDAGVLARVMRFEVGLADVVDDVVLLPRDHPGLRGHLAEAVGEGAIQGVGVAAVLERRGGEPGRSRQRAGLIPGPMAVGADAVVNRRAAPEVFRPQLSDDPGVVEPAFVVGQGWRHEGRVGPEGAGARRSKLGDLHEVSHQVEELLARSECIDQPGRHQRRPALAPLLDPAPGDRDRLAALSGVAEDHDVGPLLGQQAGDGPAVLRGDRDRLVSRLDCLGRLQDRFDEVDVGRRLSQSGQVGAEPRRRVGWLAQVALGAGEGRLKEDQRSASGIAQAAGIAGQRRRVLSAELLVERSRHARRGIAILECGQCHGQQDGRHQGVDHVACLRCSRGKHRCHSGGWVRLVDFRCHCHSGGWVRSRRFRPREFR